MPRIAEQFIDINRTRKAILKYMSKIFLKKRITLSSFTVSFFFFKLRKKSNKQIIKIIIKLDINPIVFSVKNIEMKSNRNIIDNIIFIFNPPQ